MGFGSANGGDIMWSWKNWIGYAGVAVSVVLVSFIVEWHIRTGWQIFWLDGLIRWWADFVMFGWVRDYQTLLGGLFALGAGAFVMISAVYQRQAAARDAMLDARERLEANVARCAIEYRSLLHQIRRSEIEEALETIRSIETTILTITTRAYALGNWLVRVNPLIIKHLRSALTPDEDSRLRALGYTLLIVEYLSFTARLIDIKGRCIHVPRERERTERRIREETGMQLDDFAFSSFVIE